LNHLVGAALLLAIAPDPSVTSPDAADRAALEALARANDAAWNAKDSAALSRQYTPDGTLRVGADAPVHFGREAVTRFLQASFARRPEGYRHLTRIDHVTMVTADIAIADNHVRVERCERAQCSLVREFANSSLVVRQADGWKLHSVRAQPLPPRDRQ